MKLRTVLHALLLAIAMCPLLAHASDSLHLDAPKPELAMTPPMG